MTKLVLEPAYVLHTRQFKETSLIVEFWTQNEGRISAIAKGAKRPKSRIRGLLSPFMGHHISCVGKSELLTLTDVEPFLPLTLHGKALVSGMYLNELLYKALPKSDPFAPLFNQYQSVLQVLKGDDAIQAQWAMRKFEFALLQALGYGLDLGFDYHNRPIEQDSFYDYQPDKGLIKVSAHHIPAISGHALLAFAQESYLSEHLKSFKWLMRTALSVMLAGQKIHTREIAGTIGEMS